MTLSNRALGIWLGILLLIFTCFTAQGLRMFYSGDDMMNMYEAWILNPWRLGKAVLFIWTPIYRPLGGVIYRTFYAVFGFHNLPLYVFCWLMLAANTLLSYPFFKALRASSFEALLAVSLTLVHGSFQDLYLSAGTIYDRLWFLFTVLGLVVYARVRGDGSRVPGWRASLLIFALCILSMDSKESGVALPVLLACYEVVFILPDAKRGNRLRETVPLFGGLAIISLVFVIGRVQRTPALFGNGAYHPQASITVWLSHMAEYLNVLVYGRIPFSAFGAGALLTAMLIAAVLLRNRSMIFGWLFFVITITPVALISTRPGYVLYVPDLGLGLYFAVLPGLALRHRPHVQFPALAIAIGTLVAIHLHYWPASFPPEVSPEKRFTEQFRRDLPALPVGAKLLFVTDDFPPATYDLPFNIRLMYRDRSIVVHRLIAPADQQPKPEHPVQYDHVFTQDYHHYVELDPTDIAESQRLHILKDISVGRDMDFSRSDHMAYMVSGLIEADGPRDAQWTMPHTSLKFDLYPAPAMLHLKFWLPEFVAKPTVRTMSVTVNGQSVGSAPLTHVGVNEISFPVPANQITLNGFTLVNLDVDNPYRNAQGEQFGIVLARAYFDYPAPASR